MFYARKSSGGRLAAPLTILGVAAALTVPHVAKADPVAADGSVGVNTQWEDGQSSVWYIELQRYGIYNVVGGIQSENDAEIRAGLQEFDWGFKQQAADGSFPGTAGGSAGQMFHSTSLFIEAAARAALLLKGYNPVSYTPDSAFYSAKIAQYTAAVHAAAEWLSTPSVAAAGQAYNQPFTHRRYLLAACLAESGALTGDSTLSAAATPYIQDGLSLQLGSGWRAAIAPPDAEGDYPAATLVAPGDRVPYGTVIKISAHGVNPERDGYDSVYQCLGLFYANTYLPYCPDPALKKQMIDMIRTGLHWEQQFIAPDGTISITGDSRMGIEDDRNGDIKQPTIPVCWAAYQLGAQSTGDAIDQTFANRVNDYGTVVDKNNVYADGAVDGNEAYSQGTSTTWSIMNQRIGVDYVERGIANEDDSLIQQGMGIINWGFAHQAANGSFGSTSSPYYGAAAFVESAARAAHELQLYAPQTYTPTTDYAAWGSTILTGCVGAGNWFTTPSVAKHVNTSLAPSCNREWTMAAALSETGSYASNTSLLADADPYAVNALAMQDSSGMDDECGVGDVNAQALGLNEAENYIAVSDSFANSTAAALEINNGLLWEAQYISPYGVISGTPNPALRAIQHVYALATGLDDSDYLQAIYNRISGAPVE